MTLAGCGDDIAGNYRSGQATRTLLAAQVINPAAPKDPTPVDGMPGFLSEKIYTNRYVSELSDEYSDTDTDTDSDAETSGDSDHDHDDASSSTTGTTSGSGKSGETSAKTVTSTQDTDSSSSTKSSTQK